MKVRENARVLIVEDESLLGETIRLLLEKMGYIVVGRAVDGRQAVEMTQSLRPDVVLMDIGLPDMDGVEATRRITEACPTPVVVLTGYDTPELVERASAAGAGAYLIKPLSPHEMGRAITVTMARFGDMMELLHLNAELRAEIAERKQAEESLRESQRQLESREGFISRIVESIPSSLVVIDRSLRLVSVNRSFLQKTRRMERTTVGRKIEEVFPRVLVQSTRLDQKVRKVFRTGRSEEGAKMAFRAPGLPTRIYYYQLTPLKLALSTVEGAQETVENVMLLMDDITERERLGEEIRQAERHLASVVQCANDMVVSMDPQGHIVTWNQAAERTSDLKAEQVKGQSLVSLCGAEQRPVMAEMLRRLARGTSVQDVEVNLLTADGQEVPVAWSCSSMRDDAGGMAGIVAVGRDLTERRQLEAQLIQSAKMASLGVMAGGIAHEVRNPLGIISSSAQLLLEHPSDVHLHTEGAQKIHAATQRASLIIENLLKLARPQSTRMRVVDLQAMLEETLALLAHEMTLQKITLRKEFQPDLPRVHGNPDLLQQVVTNLILNARNAMPQGGRLTVATRTTEAEQVEIQLSDTGVGISPENLSKMFVPFFTTMPVGRGIGLGLAISYSIIQQHQGTIEVESQEGKGSTFIIRLPVGGEPVMSEPVMSVVEGVEGERK